MPKISDSDALRLQNLRALHGRTPYFGAPKSNHLEEFLEEKGVRLGVPLTAIYQQTQPLTAEMASRIESAFELEQGWMSCDHEFLYKLSTAELRAHARLALLPRSIREKIFSVVEEIHQHAQPARE
jgi:plasmid maintenance system antidote protein VapI